MKKIKEKAVRFYARTKEIYIRTKEITCKVYTCTKEITRRVYTCTKEITRRVFICSKEIARVLYIRTKEVSQFLWREAQIHRKGLFVAGLALLGIFLAAKAVHFIRTDVFYYRHQFQNQVVSDRRVVRPLKAESKLQAYVRMYFAGGSLYSMQLPYNGQEKILGIYHNDAADNLIIDWAAGFAQNWQEGVLEKDTELFFLSLRKNFRIKSIRFLVEGRPSGLKWGDFSLDEGFSLDKDENLGKK